jgi:hypothetical protein
MYGRQRQRYCFAAPQCCLQFYCACNEKREIQELVINIKGDHAMCCGALLIVRKSIVHSQGGITGVRDEVRIFRYCLVSVQPLDIHDGVHL